MRLALVGEVRTAEYALRGMLRSGHPPCALFTTDVAAVRRASGMAASYYADLPALGAAHGIPTHVVPELSARADALAALRPDYIFVMGWPYLVRAPVLDIAPCVGMHPTRLPERRGGAPVNWTLIDGETSSAVSLFRLRAGVDDGELLAQREFAIAPDDYASDVLARILALTEELVAESVRALRDGTARWVPQRDAEATYTRRRRPDDGRITWGDSAVRIRNLVRATSHPFPGAFGDVGGLRVRVWRAEIPRGYRAPLQAEPGAVLGVRPDGVLVATRDNALLVTEAQVDAGASLAGPSLASAFGPLVGRAFT
jgi:methionyl-tRNA formyltransferase